MANARSTGSCTMLRTIHEIAASTITARQAAKNAFTEASPEVSDKATTRLQQSPVRQRKAMEWFKRKTSIAGYQISNWIIVLGAIIIVLLIFQNSH